jgi:hypothetical protein
MVSQAWWHICVIPVLQKLSQKDPKFKASLGYIVRSYIKEPGRIDVAQQQNAYLSCTKHQD